MAKLSFYLKPGKQGVVKITGIIRNDALEKTFPTGFEIPALKNSDGYKHWDKKKNQVKSSYSGASKINAALSDFNAKFNAFLSEITRKKKTIHIQEFIDHLTGQISHTINNETVETLRQGIDFYKARNQHILGDNTSRHYVVLQNMVEKFEKKNKTNVYLQDVNADFYFQFSNLAIKGELSTIKKPLSNSYVNKRMQQIKTVCDYAAGEGFLNSSKHRKVLVLPDIDESNKVPLTLSELDQLWAFESKDKNYMRWKEIFLFLCYTGIRYSEASQFSTNHLITQLDENAPGGIVRFMNFRQIKTRNKNLVPLPNMIFEKIVEKYMPENGGPVFNISKNMQPMNKVLKRIAEQLEWNRVVVHTKITGNKRQDTEVPLHEAISSHFGRYTCSYLQEIKGVSFNDRKNNLGQKSSKVAEKYNKLNDYKRIIDTLTKLGM